MPIIVEIGFGLSLATLIYISWRLLSDLNHFGDWIVRPSREGFIWTFNNRHWLAFAFVLLLPLATAFYAFGLGRPIVFWSCLSIALVLFGIGYIKLHFFRNIRSGASCYVPVEQAQERLEKTESLIVVETASGALGFPVKQLAGQRIIGLGDTCRSGSFLTFCRDSNLGIAYVPEIGEREVQPQALTELQSNQVIWDRVSGRLIQQIWGQFDAARPHGPTMTELPSFRMPVWGFAKAFPEGRVFLGSANVPSKNIIRKIVARIYEGLWLWGPTNQSEPTGPTFPTIERIDNRLPDGKRVYAASLDKDCAAWTEQFVRENNNLVNTALGNRNIVIAYHNEFDSIAMYLNEGGNQVSWVKFGGRSDQGTLPRLETMKSGVYWAVWQNFFPNTDVNRAAPITS